VSGWRQIAVYAHGINAPKDVTVHGDEVLRGSKEKRKRAVMVNLKG